MCGAILNAFEHLSSAGGQYLARPDIAAPIHCTANLQMLPVGSDGASNTKPPLPVHSERRHPGEIRAMPPRWQ